MNEEKYSDEHQQIHKSHSMQRSLTDISTMRQRCSKRHRNNQSLTNISASVQAAIVIDRNLHSETPTIQEISQHTSLYKRINLMNQTAWIQLCAHLLQKYSQASVSGDRVEQLSCLVAFLQLPARALSRKDEAEKRWPTKLLGAISDGYMLIAMN
jgi:hypothetical protein